MGCSFQIPLRHQLLAVSLLLNLQSCRNTELREEDFPAPGTTGAVELRYTKEGADAVAASLESGRVEKILPALQRAQGMLRPDVKAAIAKCLKHENADVRANAFDLVLPCEVTTGYPLLAERLAPQFPGPFRRGHHRHQSFDSFLPPSTAWDLPELSGPLLNQFEALGEAALPVLVRELKDDNREHRDIAVFLLGKTRSSKAVPFLKEMLDDPEPVVRARALVSLDRIGSTAALNALYSLKDRDDRELVRQAALFLALKGDPRADTLVPNVARNMRELPTPPLNPLRLVTLVPTARSPEHVSIDGNLLFVGGKGALEVFNVSNWAKPERIGRFSVGNQGVEQMVARDGKLWLTAHAEGLFVYGYNEAGDLHHVSSHPMVDWGAHFMMNRNRMLVFSKAPDAQALLFDITPKGPPVLLDSRPAKDLYDCSLTGEFGFFTTASCSGEKIDTAEAISTKAFRWDPSPSGAGFTNEGRLYYLTRDSLTVRDARSANLLGSAPAPRRIGGALAVRGPFAYALLDEIVIYDVSDPTAIKVVSRTPYPVRGRDVYRGLSISERHFSCVGHDGRLLIFELPHNQ